MSPSRRHNGAWLLATARAIASELHAQRHGTGPAHPATRQSLSHEH